MLFDHQRTRIRHHCVTIVFIVVQGMSIRGYRIQHGHLQSTTRRWKAREHADDQTAVDSFFAAADPFRRFKAQERRDSPESGGDTVVGAMGSIELHDDSWREELLDSARRGEQITAFTTTHQASILTRAMS